MRSQIRSLVASLRALDPAVLSADGCAVLVADLAVLGKACDAARARLAVRAASCGAHRRAGFLEAADWLASQSGISSTEAKRALDTAEAVESCPATREALAAGAVSLTQASEITKTEAVVPGSEPSLLAVATAAPLRVLREKAQATRLRAADADELARRQHASRAVRHWRDDLGMVRLAAALPPAAGVAFLARLDAETERVRRSARRDGREETWEAHAADALVRLGTDARPPRSDVVFVCDLRAYRRGRAEGDERCQVVRGGPVPVTTIRRALDDDAFVKVAFTDGVEVTKVTHFGRHLRAELRTALELGPPPDFDGTRCACGCGKRYKLQFDHIDPLANRGPTCLANLQPLTAREHAEKTRRDRAAGLLSGAARPPPGGQR